MLCTLRRTVRPFLVPRRLAIPFLTHPGVRELYGERYGTEAKSGVGDFAGHFASSGRRGCSYNRSEVELLVCVCVCGLAVVAGGDGEGAGAARVRVDGGVGTERPAPCSGHGPLLVGAALVEGWALVVVCTAEEPWRTVR